MRVIKELLFLILILSLTYVFAQENNRQEASSNDDTESSWGNRGILYSKPPVPEGAPKEKAPLQPKKPTVVKPKTVKPTVTKPPPSQILEPVPIRPAPKKTVTKEPPQYEETEEQELPEITAAPVDENTAALRAKLEETLEKLALANQKIAELEKQLAFSKLTTQTYQVKKGDSLWTIAAKKEVYGNPYKWLLLYHANRDQIYDPNIIFPYMVLIVPRLEEHENKAAKQ